MLLIQKWNTLVNLRTTTTISNAFPTAFASLFTKDYSGCHCAKIAWALARCISTLKCSRCLAEVFSAKNPKKFMGETNSPPPQGSAALLKKAVDQINSLDNLQIDEIYSRHN